MKRRKEIDEDLEVEDEPHPKKPKEDKSNGSHATISDSPSRRQSSRKHRTAVEHGDDAALSPKESRLGATAKDSVTYPEENGLDHSPVAVTPSAARTNGDQVNDTPSKRLKGKRLFSTPVKATVASEVDDTPKLKRNVDRSARRKSTKMLIERNVLGNTSDNDNEDEDIAQRIYNYEEDNTVGEGFEAETSTAVDAPSTPVKRGRGRPKGSKNRMRSPTPPLDDLPPHEKYFFQNRGGRVNTSDNNLSSLALLDHEEYFSLGRSLKDPHLNDMEALQELHAKSFNQWQFELSQDFNICVYGYGSKRSLLMRFADHMYKSQLNKKIAKIAVVNGYVHNLTIRDVLNTVAAAVSGPDQRLGSQPTEMLETLVGLLEENKTQNITIIVHSIDGMPLRRPTTQAILSRLSAHPQVHLIASADHPSFPLLWDSSLRSTYNFLFHNCTTFLPYISEVDVVEEVHELLGRSGRRVGGKEGVSFVLKSLPENAKNLFRVLVGEQLAAMDDSYTDGFGDFNDNDNDENEQQAGSSKRSNPGVEYQTLYQKAVEEFICSNEMNFRTLLKEFHDHQMIQSQKDALGTEMLSAPFRKEELETILEDIIS